MDEWRREVKGILSPIFQSAADRERAALEFRNKERVRVRKNDPEEIAASRIELATLQKKEPPQIQLPHPHPSGVARRLAEDAGHASNDEHKRELVDRLDRHDGWSRDRAGYDNGRHF